MDFTAGLLLVIGAFYVFAGLVAARAALISRLLDDALATISGTPTPRAESLLSAWMIAAANVVLAGGVALMLRLELALWLFLASLAGQAIFLAVLAPGYFDRADPPDPAGRRQTWNAAMIYAVTTTIVAAAYANGRLQPLAGQPTWLLATAAGIVAAHAAHCIWKTLATADAPRPPLSDAAIARAPPVDEVRRVGVMAQVYRLPLWSMEDGQDCDFAPEEFGLSVRLCRDLTDWAESYLASIDERDPEKSRWSEQQMQRHEATGHKLAVQVAQERPDLQVHAFSSVRGFEPVSTDEPIISDKPL